MASNDKTPSIHYARYERMVSERHAWLRVPVEHLDILNLLKRISPFSKKDGKFVWLEKSLDAERFRTAFEWYTGSSLEQTEKPVEHTTVQKMPAYFP